MTLRRRFVVLYAQAPDAKEIIRYRIHSSFGSLDAAFERLECLNARCLVFEVHSDDKRFWRRITSHDTEYDTWDAERAIRGGWEERSNLPPFEMLPPINATQVIR